MNSTNKLKFKIKDEIENCNYKFWNYWSLLQSKRKYFRFSFRHRTRSYWLHVHSQHNRILQGRSFQRANTRVWWAHNWYFETSFDCWWLKGLLLFYCFDYSVVSSMALRCWHCLRITNRLYRALKSKVVRSFTVPLSLWGRRTCNRRGCWRGCYRRGCWGIWCSSLLAWTTCSAFMFFRFARWPGLWNIAVFWGNSECFISLSVPYLYISSVFFLTFLGMLCILLFRRLVIRQWASLSVLPQFRIWLCQCSKFSNIIIAHLHFCDFLLFDFCRCRGYAYNCTAGR